MKRLLLGLVLGTIAALVVLLVVRIEHEPVAAIDPAAPAPATAPSEAPAAASATGDVALVGGDTPLAAPTDASASRAEAPAAAAGPRATVTGSVAPPAGCAPDSTAEVVAVGTESEIDLVLRQLERGTRRRPHQPNPFGPDPEPAPEPRDAGVLGRAPVEPDGSFRLEVPAATATAHLIVVGRSWHGRSTEPVDVTAGTPARLVTWCGAWIEGVARVPPGRAATELDGVEIELETSPEGLTGDVRTARALRREARVRDGRFEFRALDPEQVVELTATPATFAAVSAKVEGLAPGRARELALDFATGGTIRGRVRDDAGAPVAGAQVRATKAGRWFGFDDRSVREGASLADGTFELAAVAAGPVQVLAQLDGLLVDKPVKVEVVDGGVTGGVEILLGTGGIIAGSVRWKDGAPAAGVPVDVSFDMTQMAGMGAFNARRGAKGAAKTDAEGRFRVSGLGPGPFVVEAHALPADEASALGEADAAERRKREHRARQGLVKPGNEALELVLLPPAGVRGRVTDVAGAPIPAFVVHAGGVGEGLLAELGQERREEKVEHAEGEFVLTGLYAGKWRIYVAADGYSAQAAVEIVLPLAADAPPLQFQLQRAATVRGTVRAPTGAPIAGATVLLDDGNPAWMRAIASQKPPEATSTDGGAFELKQIPAGRAVLRARHEEHASSAEVVVELAPGQVVEGVELALLVGGRITGEVFHDGKPATGMMVQVQDTKNFGQRMTRTDASGRFEAAHLDPGNYQIVAFPAGGLTGPDESGEFDQAALMANLKMANAEVADGGEAHVVLGAPPEDPVKVTGRITMAGAPVARATVMFLPEGGKKGLAAFKPVTTKEDGTYAVTLDGPGPYNVTVQRTDAQMTSQSVHEERRVIPKEKEHALDIALPEGRISGRVLLPDGKPGSGVRVSVVREGVGRPGTTWGGQFHELRTDNEGEYDATGLPPGTYTVLAGGGELGGMLAGATNISGGREMRGGIELSERDWRQGVDFRLKTPGSVEILVVDAGGSPVSGAVVFARDENGRPVESFSFVTSDSAGRATYQGLAPGRYTFRARNDSISSGESAAVRVEEGAKAELKLQLEKGTVLLVKVVDAEKAPLPASIEVLDEGGRNLAAQVGMAEIMSRFQGGGFDPGEQRFGPFPPGKYRVRATLEDGRVVTKPVTLSGQAERKITLEYGARHNSAVLAAKPKPAPRARENGGVVPGSVL